MLPQTMFPVVRNPECPCPPRIVSYVGGTENDGDILVYDETTDTWVPVAPNPGDITAVNVTAPITGGGASGAVTIGVDTMVGDSGAGGARGVVPTPAAGDALKFLRGDATWAAVAGGGVTVLANVVDNASVTAAFGATTDIITSGAVATAAGKSHLIIFGCDFYNNPDNINSNLFKVIVDATSYGGVDPQKYDAVSGRILPITLVRLVTGLAAGNHTFKVSITAGAAGGITPSFTNSYSGAETATRLIVLEI